MSNDEFYVLRKEIAQMRAAIEKDEERLKRIDALLFSEGVEDRRVVDDLMLVRKLVHRFGSAKMLLGVGAAIFSFLLSAVLGAMKLYELLEAVLKK